MCAWQWLRRREKTLLLSDLFLSLGPYMVCIALGQEGKVTQRLLTAQVYLLAIFDFWFFLRWSRATGLSDWQPNMYLGEIFATRSRFISQKKIVVGTLIYWVIIAASFLHAWQTSHQLRHVILFVPKQPILRSFERHQWPECSSDSSSSRFIPAHMTGRTRHGQKVGAFVFNDQLVTLFCTWIWSGGTNRLSLMTTSMVLIRVIKSDVFF